ncbi:MAG: agmatinase [Clostridia bacterium]|nr:agmatinase [Clostridia bacterium]
MVHENEREVLNLPFVGIASFAKYPIHLDLDTLNADVAVFGMPFDMTTQWRPGTKMGPRGIRDSSCLYSLGHKGSYDPERDEVYLHPEVVKVVDVGDVDQVHGDMEQCFDNIEKFVQKLVDRGVMPVGLGGDHAVTIPFAKALKDYGPFNVIQIDAHLDFCDHRSGMRLGQGSPIRRLSEMDHVKKIWQVGIRGIGSSHRSDFEEARAYGSTIVSPRQLRKMGIEALLETMPKDENYFITFDIDGLDATIAMGTGTPSPGGLYYNEVQELLEGVAKRGNVIGFDLVEVAPCYDHSGMTCQTAARMILDFIGFITKEKEKKGTLLSQR